MIKQIQKARESHGWTCLFDRSCNELLDIFDENFSEFFHVLNEGLELEVKVNRRKEITQEILSGVDILVIGCPTMMTFQAEEIGLILKFVREGGHLLVISDAGGDAANETNLNRLLSHFHVQIEPTMVRDPNMNAGSEVAPILEDTSVEHPVTRTVMRLVVGGACTLDFQEPAVPLAKTGEGSLIELYSPNSDSGWEVIGLAVGKAVLVATTYGQGRVVVAGDVDMFSNDKVFGIHAFDNLALVKNIFSWFKTPIDSKSVTDWMIDRIAMLESAVNRLVREQDILKKKYERLARILKNLLEKENVEFFPKSDAD